MRLQPQSRAVAFQHSTSTPSTMEELAANTLDAVRDSNDIDVNEGDSLLETESAAEPEADGDESGEKDENDAEEKDEKTDEKKKVADEKGQNETQGEDDSTDSLKNLVAPPVTLAEGVAPTVELLHMKKTLSAWDVETGCLQRPYLSAQAALQPGDDFANAKMKNMTITTSGPRDRKADINAVINALMGHEADIVKKVNLRCESFLCLRSPVKILACAGPCS